ncbi:hypothetical protein LZZ85_00365 [Terrimonas sp. NA20]|uniref:Gliding motility-associated protein GldM first immunoglobulin-like domain-containing protein n=1 Tax=Terrimonas ginsenosidimutans TaxID=2908004 RepID=A0ABS9KK49_9BACT|nr:hypothetical protein [Terrimonas ginsenosidimutans]MCG2612703.1 hypothetical protein [Terrimonas ginsenosidimutans]
MQLRYTRRAVPIAFVCTIISLSSCKDQAQEQAFLASLDQTIAQSTLTSAYKMEYEVNRLEEKAADPCTQVKAEYWLPIARKVERLTNELSASILNLKEEQTNNAKKAASLHDSLRHRIHTYRDTVLGLHEQIKQYFADRFDGLDTVRSKQADLITQLRLLRTATSSQVPILLVQLRYAIMQTGDGIISFCGENVSCCGLRFDYYTAIIGQSANIVLPGQKLEITAGIGAFSIAASPKITINGKLCQLTEDGLVRFPLIAPGNAGKYKVPVRIDYVDPYGKPQTISKDLMYEVFDKK